MCVYTSLSLYIYIYICNDIVIIISLECHTGATEPAHAAIRAAARMPGHRQTGESKALIALHIASQNIDEVRRQRESSATIIIIIIIFIITITTTTIIIIIMIIVIIIIFTPQLPEVSHD